MESIQPHSQKIQKVQKIPRNKPSLSRNFICGGCTLSYGSYPALYCHVRRKHDGIMPPGTKIHKKEKLPEADSKGGRPNKPMNNIDDVPDKVVRLEEEQNELMSLIAERLMITSGMGPKNSLESIVQKVLETNKDYTDKWMMDLKEESKKFLEESNFKNRSLEPLDFDDEFRLLNPKKGLSVIVWFMIWLGNVYVKLVFIPEICLVLSRVWKVLEETRLVLQDLDNKLVWKKIMRECEGLITDLPIFKNDLILLNEFIQKVCQLIGRTFEDDDADTI